MKDREKHDSMRMVEVARKEKKSCISWMGTDASFPQRRSMKKRTKAVTSESRRMHAKVATVVRSTSRRSLPSGKV